MKRSVERWGMKGGVTISLGGIKVGKHCAMEGGTERGARKRVEKRLYFYSICLDNILIFL